MIPTSAAETHFTYNLVIYNSYPTYFRKDVRWLTAVRSTVRIVRAATERAKAPGVWKSPVLSIFLQVAVDTWYT